MKYIACFLPMLAGIEILSLICLCAMSIFLTFDILKVAAKM